MRPFLSRVGLDNVSSHAIAGLQEPFASHSSVVATRDGARVLLRPPRGTQSVFGAVEPLLASKDLAEALAATPTPTPAPAPTPNSNPSLTPYQALAGVIVNRISLIASNGAATGCAASSIPWKASRANSYTEDAKPAYRAAAIGYRKVHRSDCRCFGRTTPPVPSSNPGPNCNPNATRCTAATGSVCMLRM
jgi:hypothetical protein